MGISSKKPARLSTIALSSKSVGAAVRQMASRRPGMGAAERMPQRSDINRTGEDDKSPGRVSPGPRFSRAVIFLLSIFPYWMEKMNPIVKPRA